MGRKNQKRNLIYLIQSIVILITTTFYAQSKNINENNNFLYSLKSLNLSQDSLEKIIKSDSNRVDAYYALALQFFSKEQIKKSTLLIKKGLKVSKLWDDSLKFNILQAEIFLKQNKPQKVISLFQNIDKNKISIYLSYYNYLMGRSYLKLNNKKQALFYFQELLKDIRYEKIASFYINQIKKGMKEYE